MWQFVNYYFCGSKKNLRGAQISVLGFVVEGAVTLVPTSIESLKTVKYNTMNNFCPLT
jgi:hypothetical protein